MSFHASLYLPVFGRANAATACGLHRLTWHMRHGGLPPEVTRADLEVEETPKLMDWGQGPSTRDDHTTGTPKRLLLGHPNEGGYGMLSLCEHIQLLWTCWAAHFLQRVALLARRGYRGWG